MVHLQNLTEQERKQYRRLEMIPGLLFWSVIFGSIIMSFIKPLWVIYFIIVFTLYWVFRVFYFMFYSIMATRNFHHEIKKDWQAKVKNELPNWGEYYHLVVLPTATEPIDVLRSSFNSLITAGYPLDKMIVAITWEARKPDVWEKNKPIIEQEYGDKFFKLITTVHPDGLPGKVKGKGANANWVGWKCKEVIDQLNIPYEKVITSYFDCDTVVHPSYFWYLTHAYITNPDPTHTSFQPAVLYSNNIWEAPAPMRITAFSTVFWLLAEQMRPERMYTFSSHAQSFKSLVDVGFWQKDIITDDSRIFLQCFLHYNGNYRVTPLYVPISMDTVIIEKTWWDGFVSLYKQQRRWGWGVEHFPYMLWNFRKKKDLIPRKVRFRYIWNLGEGMFSWASAPILLFVLGRLPLFVANTQVKSTVIAQNAPFVLEKLMFVGMAGILLSAVLSMNLLPPRPAHQPKYKYLIMFFQWALLPITLILFGSIPAADAQTRLMLGKYLGSFFVTPKKRAEGEKLKV